MSLGIAPEDNNVHLCASMLYHAAPLDGVITALHMGHRIILLDLWSPKLMLRTIELHQVTTTFMVPTMFVRLLKLDEGLRDKHSVTSLRFVVHSAAPCPVETKRAMIEWWGPIIWESYGATEGQGSIVDSADWLKYPGTVGQPIPGSQIRILDDHRKEQPRGRIGKIYLTHHTGDRFHYKGDPLKTRDSYDGEFFTVGDVGYLNEEGYLFVCGRDSEVIICSGMNIYPAEIERILLQHHAVVDCAVYGVPDPLLGQVPEVAVQMNFEYEPDSSLKLDLLQFLSKRLSAMKLPRRIKLVKRLPRDPNGKLFKRLLFEGSFRPRSE